MQCIALMPGAKKGAVTGLGVCVLMEGSGSSRGGRVCGATWTHTPPAARPGATRATHFPAFPPAPAATCAHAPDVVHAAGVAPAVVAVPLRFTRVVVGQGHRPMAGPLVHDEGAHEAARRTTTTTTTTHGIIPPDKQHSQATTLGSKW